jgi:hypothetical protein
MALAEPVIIPFGDTPSFFVDVPIQGFVYRFKYKYNSRLEYWSYGIYTTQDEVLIDSVKIVLNYNGINQYVDRGLPDGKIIPIRIGESTQRITKDELINGTVLLCFFEEIDDA